MVGAGRHHRVERGLGAIEDGGFATDGEGLGCRWIGREVGEVVADPAHAEAAGRGGGACLAAVERGEDMGHVFGRPFAAAEFEQGADHVADLVVEEAGTDDVEAEFEADAVDVAAEDGADVGGALVSAGGEGGEVVRADEDVGGFSHGGDVERLPDVVGAVVEELFDGAALGVEDAVTVELGDGGLGGVEGERDLGEVYECAVLREARADGVKEGLGGQAGEGEEVGFLAGGVDARVGATCAEDVNLVADNAPDGLFDGVLDGSETGLSLPAIEGGAVVGEGELEVAHPNWMIRLVPLVGESGSVVAYAGFARRRERFEVRTFRWRRAVRDFSIASCETRSKRRSPQVSQRQCGIAATRRAVRGSGLGHGSEIQWISREPQVGHDEILKAGAGVFGVFIASNASRKSGRRTDHLRARERSCPWYRSARRSNSQIVSRKGSRGRPRSDWPIGAVY